MPNKQPYEAPPKYLPTPEEIELAKIEIHKRRAAEGLPHLKNFGDAEPVDVTRTGTGKYHNGVGLAG